MTHTRGYRFADFELDLGSGELRRRGVRIHLQEQPLQVLGLLLERRGEVVTREDLRAALWPADTFVDFDHGLNNAVRRLRDALRDAADSPHFVETVARRGYRFIAHAEPLPDRIAGASSPPTEPVAPTRRRPIAWAAALAAIAALGTLLALAVRRPPTPRPGPIMLAVLPLANLSGDPAQEYLSDGLTEELIGRLSMVQPATLRVIARSSSMHYKGTAKRADEIARELRADYLLEGSVRREGSRVRVSVQLVQAGDQAHRWSGNYERELRDVLALQKDLAGAVAREVQLQLTPEERARLTAAGTVDPEGYLDYLRGRHAWSRRTREGLEQALALFTAAAARDPSWAAPYSGVADAYVFLTWFGYRPTLEVRTPARDAAQASLAREPALAEAHASLALVHYFLDWDFPAAEREFRRALELNSGYASAHSWYAVFLSTLQRHGEARRHAQLALELDPLSPSTHNALAYVDLVAGRPDDCLRETRRALEIDPTYFMGHKIMGWAYERKGLFDDALAAYERDRSGSGVEADGDRARTLAIAGRENEARDALARYEAASRERFLSAGNRARIYAALGDKDKAMELLEQAYRERGVNLVTPLLRQEFANLADDPRFQDLVRRVGLPANAGPVGLPVAVR